MTETTLIEGKWADGDGNATRRTGRTDDTAARGHPDMRSGSRCALRIGLPPRIHAV